MANGLEQYWRKRDFKQTSEPAGKKNAAGKSSPVAGYLSFTNMMPGGSL